MQRLQLEHGHAYPALRTTRTLEGLEAATAQGLLDAADEAVLAEAWRLATDLRGAIALRGKTRDKDVLPGDTRELGVLGEILSLRLSGAQLADRYGRVTRRSRAVTERVFFGWDPEQ
ncbi:hypothetical protein [Demequina litorisediminis]|uniref:Uncharacterized protein n=1 Tax=Demequina litorisediminis TaxID=1849022 RepID=A0ABQ6I8F1_9MICO|nr:hypothetical protein [Demequina litorisediminis]GMA34060.1 hypothetical protein GCM10025876_02640 [Demequina litorisediminis]